MGKKQRPNILFIMSDDHAAEAISCYSNKSPATPNIDRLAKEGIRFNRTYCTNALCAPSRATILTGQYSHINGVRGLGDSFDGNQQTFPKLMKEDGYQTAIVGKWHLGHGGNSDPTGFDYWNILPGQGDYYNPRTIENGLEIENHGYVTDIITDQSIKWLENRDLDKPFMLMVHHKAPHRPWDPPEKFKHLYKDKKFPVPDNFYDQYENRSNAAKVANMRIEDLTERDVKAKAPEGLTKLEERSWKFQRYMKDYFRCVASIDENVGYLLDFLDEHRLTENTIVVYTSDQGFFLGEHGWYDKRFMYEESLRMPFLMRYPKEIYAGSEFDGMVINNDFAPTFLDYANVDLNEPMQGNSFRGVIHTGDLTKWRKSMYYRYWEHMTDHKVSAHYGIRTDKYKLIYYYAAPMDIAGAMNQEHDPEWELFDLEKDPKEMNNVYHVLEYEKVVTKLKAELSSLRELYGEKP